MKFAICSFGFLFVSLTAAVVAAQITTIDFNNDKVGEAPSGFSTALTGRGKPGKWVVMRDPASPNRGNVLAQTDADRTDYRFPVCVYDGLTAKDVDISVKFKPVSGRGDQGAGIVWRYQDKDNYYIVRANALEGNVVLYKVENGKRTDLPLKGKGRTYGMKDKVASGEWGTLRVVANGNHFEIYHNEKRLYDVEDETFKAAGKVGLWTKADSVIYLRRSASDREMKNQEERPGREHSMDNGAKSERENGEDHQMPSWREVFLYFLFLGFVNVGGPVAQITMMYNHMVERRQWLTKDRFVKIMAFCHMLPGPEALQLAIYVGYLKRKLLGGILAGLTFIIPGAIVMIILSWLYVTYGSLPQVNNFLYVLKPAVLGIIAAGIIKLGRAAIRKWFLAVLLVGAFVGMRFAGINFLLILLLAGLLNLLFVEGWPRLRRARAILPVTIAGLGSLIPFGGTRWFQMAWLFLETGLFSFGGAYASLAFVQRGAVAQYHWLSNGQLLDGVALSVATPGPFMLFTTFAGYLAGGVRGALIATFFVFLPSFVFVLGGARYIELVRDNRWLQAFLAGVSAAVVGVIIVVSIDLIPTALVGWVSIAIATIAFLVIALLKVDVAFVALGAMAAGIVYVVIRALM